MLCAYGYSARVQGERGVATLLMSLASVYLGRQLRRWLPGAKRIYVYSINLMRALHPAWFREDLERLFGLLATRAIHPRVAERIGFDEVADAHRRIEAGGLDGQARTVPGSSVTTRPGAASARAGPRMKVSTVASQVRQRAGLRTGQQRQLSARPPLGLLHRPGNLNPCQLPEQYLRT
jgi:hypothetical protein